MRDLIVALKAQKRIAQGKAQRHPGLFHVGDGRAESAKAWITAGYLTLRLVQPYRLVFNYKLE